MTDFEMNRLRKALRLAREAEHAADVRTAEAIPSEKCATRSGVLLSRLDIIGDEIAALLKDAGVEA